MRKRRLHFASDERRLHLASCGARLARLAFLLLLAATPGVTYAQSGAPQTDAAGRVSVLFTALGKDKKFNTSLKPEDIRVSVDGAAREVLELKRQSGVPLFLAVVIDTSASQESVLPKTKMAAGVFVRGMMSPGVDEAAVVTFATDTTLEQGMTADVSKVRAAIARVKFVPPPGYLGGGVLIGTASGGATGVWDAVWLVSRDVMSRSLGTGRRAVLLVTDGVDTSSRVKLDEAVASALQSEVVVYAVGIGDSENFDGVDRSPLRKLAERTGGRAFFPKKINDVTAIFTQISEELQSQYVVTLAPLAAARDGSFHKLKIEITNRELRGAGVELAYPQGFYSGNAPTAVKK